MGRRPDPATVEAKRVRPTYGDLAPRLAARGYYARIFRDAIFGLGVTRAGRRIPLADFYAQENDPMQITLHLRECANGVLLSKHNCGGPYAQTDAPETYYPSWDDALADLEQQGRAAIDSGKSLREELLDRAACEDKGSPGCDNAIAVDSEGYFLKNADKLPEEAAAEAAPGPVPEFNGFNQDAEDDGDTTIHPDFSRAGPVVGVDDAPAAD